MRRKHEVKAADVRNTFLYERATSELKAARDRREYGEAAGAEGAPRGDGDAAAASSADRVEARAVTHALVESRVQQAWADYCECMTADTSFSSFQEARDAWMAEHYNLLRDEVLRELAAQEASGEAAAVHVELGAPGGEPPRKRVS